MGKDGKNFWNFFWSPLTGFTKLIWLLIGLVVLAGIGRYLSQNDAEQRITELVAEKPLIQPLPWTEVDQAVVEAVTKARQTAKTYADRELDAWIAGLMQRVDTDFLGWYFSYWTQQMLGLEGIWQYGLNSFFENQPTAAEKLTEEIQMEFSRRVLRPQIAELVLERIARETAEKYVAELRKNLEVVPLTYKIPHADWQRYLEGIALTTYGSEGNRETDITLKTFTLTTVGGSVFLVGKMKFMLGKLSGKVLAKSTGKAAAKIATKTGAKVAAKVGGKFLGPIVGIGVLVWDVWDHNRTRKENLPILRQSIADYFAELKDILQNDPEAGILVMFNDLESQIYNAVKSAQETGSR